jgi:TolA-binding protein
MDVKLQLLLAGAALMALSPSASAQDGNVEGRVIKLEKEMKAVQRKVFPDGAGKYFEPEIKPADAVKDPSKPPSGSEVSDLIARVDALESQLSTLTGQVETQGNGVKAMEARLKSLEAQVKALSTAAESPTVAAIETAPKPATTATKSAATTPTKATTPPAATKPTVAKPSAAREAAVAKIEKPKSADAFDDSYNYGYRLWQAKFYPEAQAQLEETVTKFPNDKRLSKARNLLGRAWLDDGRPSQAAKIFYDNYKADANGERAPDSLYYLGESLIKMDKPADACEVFGQFVKAYPDIAKGRLATQLASGRAKAKCK